MSSLDLELQDRWGRGLQIADSMLGRLEDATNLVAGILVFGLMLLGVSQVVSRNLFSAPIFGYIDIVEVFMVGFTILSIAYVQRLGGHVRMEVLLSALKGRRLWILELISCTLTSVIVAVLIPGSYAHFSRAFEFGDSTMDVELAVWPAKLVVPVALSVLLVRLLIQLMGYARMVRNPSLPRVAIPTSASSADRAKEEIAMVQDVEK
ncbi:MAG: TRAP transporter small permease [Gammaproteobacteria bacterium]|nr:TRAP transporter small permease [Gammaproteobacteria bacterium]